MSKTTKKSAIKPSMYDAILAPVITEKSQMGAEFNKFTFNVSSWATKSQIKEAVNAIFGAEVVKVNVVNTKGKVKKFKGTLGKRKDTRKAIITLAEGQSIDVVATV